MDAALLAMISTLFVAVLGNSWHQSRENGKTRDLMIIDQEPGLASTVARVLGGVVDQRR